PGQFRKRLVSRRKYRHLVTAFGQCMRNIPYYIAYATHFGPRQSAVFGCHHYYMHRTSSDSGFDLIFLLADFTDTSAVALVPIHTLPTVCPSICLVTSVIPPSVTRKPLALSASAS